MHEIRLLFTPLADASRQVQLTDADGKSLGVAQPFTLTLTEDDDDAIRWYLESVKTPGAVGPIVPRCWAA